MITSIALALLLSISFVFGAPRIADGTTSDGPKRGCGTHISPEKLAEGERSFESSRIPAESLNATVTLDLYIFIVSANRTTEGGWIPDSRIKEQVDVLKNDYSSTGLRWNHVNTTRIISEEWFKRAGPGTIQDLAMKKSFRTGNASVLHVYTTGMMEGTGAGLLGYATFPFDYKNSPEIDGVVVRYSTFPGGTTKRYNGGRTLTHEIGHWLGLYHTFEGGCSLPGDLIDDTAPEASPAYGCPEKRHTCKEGDVDPVRNFMDYSDDSCMTNFTPGQATRIKAQLRTYRGVDI